MSSSLLKSVWFLRVRLIGFREQYPARTWLSRDDTVSRLIIADLLIERDTANRHLQLFFDLGFNLGTSRPVRERKSAVDLRLLFILWRKEIVEVLFGIDPDGVRVSKFFRAIIEVFLNVSQDRGDLSNNLAGWPECFLLDRLISSGDGDRAGGKITRTDLDADGHPALDPFPVPHPSAKIALINFHPDGLIRIVLGNDPGPEGIGCLMDRLFCLFFRCDRKNYNVGGRNSGWQHRAIIVGVRHDDCADQASACAPAGRPDVFLIAVSRNKFNVGCLCKILAEKMRSAGLNRFAILHNCFDAESLNGAGKPFACRLFSVINGQREVVASECGV